MAARRRARSICRLADVLIRRAEADGVVRDLWRAGDDVELDAGGAAVIPGLHDHHIHILALAAALVSVDVSSGLAPLRTATGTGWIRAVGYPDDLDRWQIDDVVADRPVRVQHRSGSLWILNSRALDAIGIEHPDGRLFRADEWLRERTPGPAIDVGAVGRLLLGRGVTGVTDATPTTSADALRLLATLPQQVCAMTAPGVAGEAPVKLIIGDHELPSPEGVARHIEQARPRPVAIHCATRVALLLALAAFDVVGAQRGDRIEHGAVMSLDEAVRVAEHGLVVVTQPSFVVERRHLYEAEVEAYDRSDLWRCATLLAAGVRVAGSTDAPYGSFDPWRAIAAASSRELGPHERVTPRAALDLFLAPLATPGGHPRRVADADDLIILDRPLADALADPAAVQVVAAFRDGRVLHGPHPPAPRTGGRGTEAASPG